MASFGGFNFGGAGKAATTTATTTAASGFSFTSTPATSTSAGGLGGFGQATPQVSASTGFTLSANTPGLAAGAGLALGVTPASVPSTGLTLGQPAGTGFGLGGTTNPATGFSLPGATTTSASTGVSFGVTPASKPATGFGLGGTAAGTTGLGGTPGLLGATPAQASAAPSFGFSKPLSAVGATTTTTSSLFGAGLKLGTVPAASTGTGLGAFPTLGGTTGALGAVGAGGSIFGQAVAKSTSSGLGGVDPKTTTSTAATDPSKTGDGKTVKETQVENSILLDVDEFRKFVKDEKGEMEQMKRMSSTPMVKVQEDNSALRQLLAHVSSGLQRNVCAVDKLKKEMTQELKNAEMSMRTKETPPGLQYENTAPMMYFQYVIENFETQMLQYRQQIEMLESHLASLHQPNRLVPEELVLLLRKLHEAFVAMAARLQQIHEAVKTQKEHYLNYRKVFHGDNRNIFERQKKAPVKMKSVSHNDSYGQTPFPGINNAAAVAMASALNRSQQPQPQTGAPPVTGFSHFQPSTGFGGASTSGFGSLGAATTQAAGFKGFAASAPFANTSNLATTQSGSLFASPIAGTASGSVLPQPNLTAGTDQPFQLNKPPVGSKRGKR